MRKKNQSDQYRPAIIAAIIAAIPLALTLFLLIDYPAHVFIIPTQLLKSIVYSIAMLPTVIVDTLLGFAGVHLSDTLFYFLTFVVNFVIVYPVCRAYFSGRTKDAWYRGRQRRFLLIVLACVVAYLALALFYLLYLV